MRLFHILLVLVSIEFSIAIPSNYSSYIVSPKAVFQDESHPFPQKISLSLAFINSPRNLTLVLLLDTTHSPSVVVYSPEGQHNYKQVPVQCLYHVSAESFNFLGTSASSQYGVFSLCEHGARGFARLPSMDNPNKTIEYRLQPVHSSPRPDLFPGASLKAQLEAPHRLTIIFHNANLSPDFTLSRAAERSDDANDWQSVPAHSEQLLVQTNINRSSSSVWSVQEEADTHGLREKPIMDTRKQRVVRHAQHQQQQVQALITNPGSFKGESQMAEPMPILHRPNQPPPRILELYMVVDETLVKLFNRDYDMLIYRVNSLISHVNALYAPFNIAVVVVRLELWLQDRDRLNIEEHHILPTLAQFKRMHTTVRHDCLHALLGDRKEGSPNKGKANSHTMCVFSRCVGFTRDSPSADILETARTMAHELGHNFGLRHDTEECKCQSCIMATGVEFGTNLMAWSPCSMRDLPILLDYGMGLCLHDTPFRTVVSTSLTLNDPHHSKKSNVTSVVRVYDWRTKSSSDPDLPARLSSQRQSARRSTATDRLCGNGVLDPGEECDCGTRESCPIQLQDCCDPQRCRLKFGSECAGGSCCTVHRVAATKSSPERFQCRLAPAGTVCRNESGNCDLPEYCDGLSGWCPADVFKADGIPCLNEEGTKSFCARGGCREADSWCRVLWGKRGRRAHPYCFAENHGIPKGVPVDPVANCGKRKPLAEERWEDPKSWPGIRCPSWQDAECGRLWCHHQNEKAMILGWIESQTRHLSSVQQSCSALVYDPVWPASDLSTWNADRKHQLGFNIAGVGLLSGVTQDIGMVPDGTPCSRGMCYNGSCVSHSEIRARFHCDCGGHGVCNNLGHCHCDPGFRPPFCEYGGDGGSVDSGPPPSDLMPNPSLVIGISLLVFLGLPFVVFTVYCAIYHRCRWIPIVADPIVPTKSGLQAPLDKGLVACIRQCFSYFHRRSTTKPRGAGYIPGNASAQGRQYQTNSLHAWTNGVSGDKLLRVMVNPNLNGAIIQNSNSRLNGPKVTKTHENANQPPPTAPKPTVLNEKMKINFPTTTGNHNPVLKDSRNCALDHCNGYLTNPHSTSHILNDLGTGNQPVVNNRPTVFNHFNGSKVTLQNNHGIPLPNSHESESPKPVISEPRLKDMTYRGNTCSLSEALNTLRRGDQLLSTELTQETKKRKRIARRPSRLKTFDHGLLLKKPSLRRTQSQTREQSTPEVRPKWDISAPRLESTTYTESLNDLDTARMLISR